MSVDMNDWQREMQRLLDVFERESTMSLRRINRCFAALGRPFDERFRQYFLKKSTIRLDMSFDTILFERYDENPIQETANSSTSNNSNAIAGNTNESSLDNIDSLNNGDLLQLNVQNNADATIEIIDSDDELEHRNEGHLEIQAADGINANQMNPNMSEQLSNDTENHDAGHVDIGINNENGSEVDVKREIKVETGTEAEMEMVDLPVVEFDPVKENSASVTESMGGEERQAGPSSSIQKREKRGAPNIFKCKNCAYTSRHKYSVNRHQLNHDDSAAKPFECEYCDYVSRFKFSLDRHQQIHANQKFIGAVRDPKDGLYKCTHCTQDFASLRALNVHWSRSHQNKQCLFNCGHCMRPFTQKTEKDRHEVRCRIRRYECYLCKIYGTRHLYDMQRHMRTHSGAMPYQCAICNRFFRRKDTLKYHLNSIHK